jgi:hypothetical protein
MLQASNHDLRREQGGWGLRRAGEGGAAPRGRGRESWRRMTGGPSCRHRWDEQARRHG